MQATAISGCISLGPAGAADALSLCSAAIPSCWLQQQRLVPPCIDPAGRPPPFIGAGNGATLAGPRSRARRALPWAGGSALRSHHTVQVVEDRRAVDATFPAVEHRRAPGPGRARADCERAENREQVALARHCERVGRRPIGARTGTRHDQAHDKPMTNQTPDHALPHQPPKSAGSAAPIPRRSWRFAGEPSAVTHRRKPTPKGGGETCQSHLRPPLAGAARRRRGQGSDA